MQAKSGKETENTNTPRHLDYALFDNSTDLMKYAREIIAGRQLGHLGVYFEQSLASMKPNSPPPFPTLLYFLAVIDFLGALYGGDASNDAKTTRQFVSYAVDFMGYSNEQATILRRLFRHKLAHLGAPAPVLLFEDRRITWEIVELDTSKHLLLEPVVPRVSYIAFKRYRLEYDYKFTVSVKALYYEIQMSVDKYLNALSSSVPLQKRFQTAITQFFELVDWSCFKS